MARWRRNSACLVGVIRCGVEWSDVAGKSATNIIRVRPRFMGCDSFQVKKYDLQRPDKSDTS